VAAQLVASRVVLSSTELVSSFVRSLVSQLSVHETEPDFSHN
jgi:hypothetical protein